VYFINGRHEIVGYNPVSDAVTLRAPLPEGTLTFSIRDNTLYATNGISVFAFDLVSSAKWSLTAPKDQRFVRVLDSDPGLWALRDDGALLEIDRATGKMLSEQTM